MEFYLDDILMQCWALPHQPSGRLGFLGDASDLHAWNAAAADPPARHEAGTPKIGSTGPGMRGASASLFHADFPVPEGRLRIAQRFIAGYEGFFEALSSPRGTAESPGVAHFQSSLRDFQISLPRFLTQR